MFPSSVGFAGPVTGTVLNRQICLYGGKGLGVMATPEGFR